MTKPALEGLLEEARNLEDDLNESIVALNAAAVRETSYKNKPMDYFMYFGCYGMIAGLEYMEFYAAFHSTLAGIGGIVLGVGPIMAFLYYVSPIVRSLFSPLKRAGRITPR